MIIQFYPCNAEISGLCERIWAFHVWDFRGPGRGKQLLDAECKPTATSYDPSSQRWFSFDDGAVGINSGTLHGKLWRTLQVTLRRCDHIDQTNVQPHFSLKKSKQNLQLFTATSDPKFGGTMPNLEQQRYPTRAVPSPTCVLANHGCSIRHRRAQLAPSNSLAIQDKGDSRVWHGCYVDFVDFRCDQDALSVLLDRYGRLQRHCGSVSMSSKDFCCLPAT